MSVEIKSLTIGTPRRDDSQAAKNDSFNLIPMANVVYDLYAAANDATEKKAAIVNSLRLVNTHTAAVVVNLYFNRPNGGLNRRRLLAPPNISLAPGMCFIDDSEITLEPGDKLQAKADTANVIQYVISGVERDMT
jgi:hypothetical protein